MMEFKPDSKEDLTEYLRRNILHAQSLGAESAAKTFKARLEKYSRQPKWMIENLDAIIQRLEHIPHELAEHRNELFHKIYKEIQ